MTATDFAMPVLGGQRVLVVDSDEDTAASLTAVLRLNGFDAHAARTGSQALTELSTRRPGVVLIDPELPDIRGWEVVRKCRSAGHGPSVIVTTGWTGAAHEAAARAAGADAVVLKPADPVQLARLLCTMKAETAEHC